MGVDRWLREREVVRRRVCARDRRKFSSARYQGGEKPVLWLLRRPRAPTLGFRRYLLDRLCLANKWVYRCLPWKLSGFDGELVYDDRCERRKTFLQRGAGLSHARGIRAICTRTAIFAAGAPTELLGPHFPLQYACFRGSKTIGATSPERHSYNLTIDVEMSVGTLRGMNF